MRQYHDLMEKVLKTGVEKRHRTGTGTISIFGHQMRFDLEAGFPLLTTKKRVTRAIIYELLWFLNGDTNVKYLQEHSVSIWDEWADANGELGPVYGYQWRSWPNPEGGPEGGTIDQISNMIADIKRNLDSRRLMVTAWNPADVPKMALPPCRAHLYLNHLDQAREQLTRKPYPLPKMHINPDVKDIFAFRYEDFKLEGYQAHPHIKAEVAV